MKRCDQMLFNRRTRQLFIASHVLLLVGCASTSPAPTSNATPQAEAKPTSQKNAVHTTPGPSITREHTVRPGDTLMQIGRIYGLDAKQLAQWNGMTDPNQLAVGQKVRLGPPTSAVPGRNGGAIAKPVQVTPVTPLTGQPAVPAVVKNTPKGGKRPYTEQSWQVANGGVAATTTTSPETQTPSPAKAEAKEQAAISKSKWLWPATGKVIQKFDESSNKGLDIAGKPGDPIIASSNGVVVYSGSGLRGYGKLIIIKHDENYLTAYAHNRKLLVKEGDRIRQGQTIAELGNSDANRPKLHFEIRRQGQPVNPMKYLPRR